MEICVPETDVAATFYLAVVLEDKKPCDDEGCVPRRHYAAARRTYINLRTDPEEAVKRAMCLFDKKCDVEKKSLVMLRIQFTHKGLSKYMTTCLPYDEAYRPVLYKMVYEYCKEDKDWGAWAFHADVPMNQKAEGGDLLISCDWHHIG